MKKERERGGREGKRDRNRERDIKRKREREREQGREKDEKKERKKARHGDRERERERKRERERDGRQSLSMIQCEHRNYRLNRWGNRSLQSPLGDSTNHNAANSLPVFQIVAIDSACTLSSLRQGPLTVSHAFETQS